MASQDGVSFRHELLRTAVEVSLAPARRRELHQKVLDQLSGWPGVDPSRLVHHARAAGDVPAVLEFGAKAGVAAARQGAHREAADHYEAASRHADRLPPDARAELLERYAVEAHLTGRQEEALRARKVALAVREESDSPSSWPRICAGSRSWPGGRRATLVRQAADRAVTVLEALPPNHELAMAYISQSQVAFMDHRLADAIGWAERARTLAQQLGDEDLAIHAQITADPPARLRGSASRGEPGRGAPQSTRRGPARPSRSGPDQPRHGHGRRACVVRLG